MATGRAASHCTAEEIQAIKVKAQPRERLIIHRSCYKAGQIKHMGRFISEGDDRWSESAHTAA